MLRIPTIHRTLSGLYQRSVGDRLVYVVMPPSVRPFIDKNTYAGASGGITHSVNVQGQVAEVKIHFQSRSRPCGQRKEITEFSDKARLAMIRYLLRINYAVGPRPLFLTLTYPDDVATPDHATRNLHRKIMARHLEHLTGKHLPCSWRIEWVPRKSGTIVGTYCPHWHLLVFGHRFIDCKEVNRLWCKTIGWADYCRTETRAVDDAGGVNMYMAKYISKDAVSCSLVYATNQSKLGRHYGWLRKKEIPLCPLHSYNCVTDAQARSVRDLAAEMLAGLNPDLDSSYTLFGDAAQDVRKILDGEPLTGAGASEYTRP